MDNASPASKAVWPALFFASRLTLFAIKCLNSLIVVSLQVPIMNWIAKFNSVQAILPLFVGMFVILFSAAFNIGSVYGALMWTFILSLIECAMSYLDKLSQDDNCLLIKEASVGVGSALTVYFVRFFSPDLGSKYIGILSILLLALSMALLFSQKISFGKKLLTNLGR